MHIERNYNGRCRKPVKKMMINKMWITKFVLLCSFLLLSLTTTESRAALSQEEIDLLRNELKNNIDHSSIGSSYAYILNFFVEPDISASTYDVADDANTRLDIYKFPLQKNFLINTDGWEIALRGIVSYATLEMDLDVVEKEMVESEWSAFSGSMGTGLIVPVLDGLTFITAADLGLSHMKNRREYHGVFTDTVAQLLDGILYNWDTDVWIGSLVFGLDYNHLFWEEYSLDVQGRYTYSHISSFNGSEDFPSFSGNAQTLSLAADLTHPLVFSVAQYPLYGVAHLGHTAFLGKNRDTLGFDSFVELGYSLKVDLSHLDFLVQSLRVGYQWSIGHNVKGHTVLFGLDLAVF